MNKNSSVDPLEHRSGQSSESDRSEESGFSDWLANIWEGRYTILLSLVIFLAIGWLSIWSSKPVFQAEAMLQVHEKRPVVQDAAFVKMEGLFSEPSEVQAEIEVLKSNRVLGRTVEVLGLDISVMPKLLPLVGRFITRGGSNGPRVEIDSFELPNSMRGQEFKLTYLKEGCFRWDAPDGSMLAMGYPGEVLHGAYGGVSLQLKVHAIDAKPGQSFFLVRKTLVSAINNLNQRFYADEKGKLTNVLGLRLRGDNPVMSAKVLNEIIKQYKQHKLERKYGDTSKALSILQEKMPEIKSKLDASENRLNRFRRQSGSVDLSQEAVLSLQQSSATSAQISALKQKKEDLLRTYKESSDVVTTLNQQIAKLQGELSHVDSKVRSLPTIQQEVVRLSRDVQVNTELYTALLNNVQQLQIAGAGEIGNVTVVDPAVPNLVPLNQYPSFVLFIYAVIGVTMGGGILAIRRALRPGIKDHRVIESKLGLPVVVTIPHSSIQGEKTNGKRLNKTHLLALRNPDDLAMESLRSLRTMLQFSMKGARNCAIMITGPSPSIGKTFISSNFSIVLAQTGMRVLVVDGDMRRGNLHHYFGLKTRLVGLSEVLGGRSNWKTVVHKTEVTGLDVISTGVIPPNPADLLMTDHFVQFVAEACVEYDYVIIDAPPILPVTDAVIIGSKVGTIFLVAKYAKHPLDELRVCQKRLENHGIALNGVVFNDVKPTGIGYKYHDYRYAYHYSYNYKT